MQTRLTVCASRESKPLDPHFDTSTFNVSWLASATFRIVGESAIYLSLAASSIIFKTQVLHFVWSHEITKDAKTESLSASLYHI